MNYRIVGCIPAGRRRYLELQVPHLLAARSLFTEIQLWLNTIDPDDIAYLYSLESDYPGFFRIITPQDVGGQPPDPEHIPNAICPFWRAATDPDTLYIRTDDDIIWMAPDALETLIQHRLQHPHAFMVFGNTINNSICSYFHQRMGCIPLSAGNSTPDASCTTAWKDPTFAEAAHRAFLNHLAEGRTPDYLFHRWILPTYQHFRINICAWFGRDFGPLDPEAMKGQEELWVTCVRPRQLKRPNEICGTALFSHFAYYPQRKHLDQTDILDQYRRYLPEVYRQASEATDSREKTLETVTPR